jgi:hypothetical protein
MLEGMMMMMMMIQMMLMMLSGSIHRQVHHILDGGYLYRSHHHDFISPVVNNGIFLIAHHSTVGGLHDGGECKEQLHSQ